MLTTSRPTSTTNAHVDHGLTGTNRARPGLREALAAYGTAGPQDRRLADTLWF